MSIDQSKTAQTSQTPHHLNSDGNFDNDKKLIVENEGEMVRGAVLGIDFGRAKVGLAMADAETKMAFALKILDNDKNLIQKLGKIIDENEVDKIVIGTPKYGKGKTIEDEARSFGKMMEKEFGVEVFFEEEMFTTKMAQANLIEKGMKGVGKLDDSEAARIILQGWLDK